jgi:hypothetical protein
MIARLQVNRLSVSLEQYLGFAFQNDQPLGFVLIVPEAFRTGMPREHDAFDTHVLAFYESHDQFHRELGWNRGKQVMALSFALLAGEHIDGLRSLSFLHGRAVEKGFAGSQRDDIVFPALRTCE